MNEFKKWPLSSDEAQNCPSEHPRNVKKVLESLAIYEVDRTEMNIGIKYYLRPLIRGLAIDFHPIICGRLIEMNPR